MTAYCLNVLASLEARFDAMPDLPSGKWTAGELEAQAQRVVWLAGWLADNPETTPDEYRREVMRTKVEGPRWRTDAKA